jgi:hypothetical protein
MLLLLYELRLRYGSVNPNVGKKSECFVNMSAEYRWIEWNAWVAGVSLS